MLKAKIKMTAQRTKVQFIGLILFAHILPALCIPLYYLIIQANAGVWIIFVLLAVMVAITWGLALLPILLAPIAYSFFLMMALSLVYLLYRSFPLMPDWLLKACGIAFVIAIFIYIALFIAYLSGAIVPPSS